MGCGIKGAQARSLSVWLLLCSSPLLRRGIPSLICNAYYQETHQAIVIFIVKIIGIIKKKIPRIPLSTPLCLLHLVVTRSFPGLSSSYFSSLIPIQGTTVDTGDMVTGTKGSCKS